MSVPESALWPGCAKDSTCNGRLVVRATSFMNVSHRDTLKP